MKYLRFDQNRALCLLCCLGLLFFGLPVKSIAASGLVVKVTVIKAGKGTAHVDPELKDLVKELSPVLNFSSFSLLKKVSVHLSPGQEEEVVLPDDRALRLKFMGFKDKKARLLARIMKKGDETFRTTVLLVDRGSVLIGGPPHEDGVLLLRIGGEFFL